MPPKSKILLMTLPAVLLALLLSRATASATTITRTIRVFRPPMTGYPHVSPQVRFRAEIDRFLVLGLDRHEAMTRQVAIDENRQLSKFNPNGLGEPCAWTLSYNPRTRTHLVPGSHDSYLLLDTHGRLLSRHLLDSTFGQNFLALTPIAGTNRWFGMVEECKYGCRWSGLIIDKRGDVRREWGMSDLPLEDEYANFERIFQAEFDPDESKILLIWEDGYDEEPFDHPSRAIRGQRMRKRGVYVGEPLEIARHREAASHPDMVYHPERKEWLIVYRRGTHIKARFLRGKRLSHPFKLSVGGAAEVPSIALANGDAASNGVYLVTWLVKEPGGRIYGRWIDAEGQPLGWRFPISRADDDARVLRSGYSACNARAECFVTWIDAADRTTRGRFVLLD
jgi:hypothetical protein